VDFKPPTVTSGNIAFSDSADNGRADSKNIRLYNNGDGYEVECASCHDTYGVPSTGSRAIIPDDGAEVIHREPYAQIYQRLHDANAVVDFLHEHA